jgi:hypothetical protein
MSLGCPIMHGDELTAACLVLLLLSMKVDGMTEVEFRYNLLRDTIKRC